MSNNITIELCAEDRARLDRLTDALERRTCDKCVKDAPEFAQQAMNLPRETLMDTVEDDEEDTREAPKNAQDEAGAETPTTAPQEVEQATAAEGEAAPWEETPTASMADVQQKVIALCTAGKKKAVTDLVRGYAERVTLIPEDKLGEVYAKLTALEG